MNRLTKRDRYNHYYTNEKINSRTNEFDCYDGSAITKLGQLEDIEGQLGIGLATLFKALKNGVYYFTIGKQLTKDYVWLVDNSISVGSSDKLSYSFRTTFEGQPLLFQDYGKTWALSVEELENE